MQSKINAKGQITIPKLIRDAMGIGAHDRVLFLQEGERVLLQPLRTLKAFRGAVKSKGPGSFTKERSQTKAAVADIYSFDRKHLSRLDSLKRIEP